MGGWKYKGVSVRVVEGNTGPEHGCRLQYGIYAEYHQ